jgi:hypothetical protein
MGYMLQWVTMSLLMAETALTLIYAVMELNFSEMKLNFIMEGFMLSEGMIPAKLISPGSRRKTLGEITQDLNPDYPVLPDGSYSLSIWKKQNLTRLICRYPDIPIMDSYIP